MLDVGARGHSIPCITGAQLVSARIVVRQSALSKHHMMPPLRRLHRLAGRLERCQKHSGQSEKPSGLDKPHEAANRWPPELDANDSPADRDPALRTYFYGTE